MLVLTRKVGEQVRIGESIVISVVDCGGNKVSVGIDAPPEVRIVRGEISRLANRDAIPAHDSRRGRILIVDDNPTDRELYRRFLGNDADAAWQFVEAETAEAGLQLLDSAAPQCVLLDYRLPDLDGVQFLAEWKRRFPTADCPVLMLTNYGSEEVVVEALKNGASDYLKKGTLTPELLCQRVRTAVTRARPLGTSA